MASALVSDNKGGGKVKDITTSTLGNGKRG